MLTLIRKDFGTLDPNAPRFWAFLLCAALCFTPAACSDDTVDPPTVTNPTSGTSGGSGGTTSGETGGETTGETTGGTTGETTGGTTGVDAGDVGEDTEDVDDADTDESDIDEPDVDELDADEPDTSDAGQDTQPDTSDAGESDAGETDADEADADEADADEADVDETDADPSDTDIPDVPQAGDVSDGDVSEDVIPDGPPIEDGGGDTGEGTEFDRSCLYPLVDCYAFAEPVSCTHNPNTENTDVSFGAGLAQRNVRGEDNRFTIEVYNQGALCFRAQAGDTLAQPLSYTFSSGDLDDLDTFTLSNNGTNTTIACADGSEETWENEAIAPYLPRVFAPEDDICTPIENPRCTNDTTCSDADPLLTCCEVADTTRCLSENACPEIPLQEPELESCLDPMLSCFGANFTLLECFIDPNDGLTEADFSQDRRASWLDDGQPNLLLETANLETGTFCYSADLPGQGPLDVVSFFDLVNNEQHLVEVSGDTATVSCADGSQETISAEDFLAYLPPRPLSGNPFCEEVDLEECTTEAQCGLGESCCDTDTGRRCLAGPECPAPDNRWQESCLFNTFDCFGSEHTLSVCTDYEAIDYTEASYVQGSSAIFSSQSNNPTFQASAPGGFLCFDSVRQIGTDQYEIFSNLEDTSFVLEIGDDESLISCPGNVSQVVDTTDVTPYLIARPDGASCDAPDPDHECEVDIADDCNDPSLVCCEGGDRRLCLGDCEDAQPRNICQDDSECADGLTCCNQANVRVCDVALCGDEVCCYLDSAQVCETDRACEEALECDPEDVNACGGGERCCQGLTSDIFICRDEPLCGDFESPVCTVDTDCSALGPEWDCCPSEGANRCQDTSANGGQCIDINPNGCDPDDPDACEEGTVCCESGGNVCIPALECGDVCRSDSDCGDGLICCEDTEQCSLQADCASAPQCQVNTDCEDGTVCCHAVGNRPLCIGAADCPSSCSTDTDCSDGQRCCGSQDSPFGTYCANGDECEDIEPRSCTINADCFGDNEVCCRTLDEPACIDGDACPEACDPANPCGAGEECCATGVRTPICVADGSCALDLGERCTDDDACGDGLTCCPYDDFGDVCVPAASCGQNIPEVSCENASNACQDFPLAVCCEVQGVAQCSDEVSCDLPSSFLCTGDEDCGTGAYRCCNEAVDSECVFWENAASCQSENSCTGNEDCPNGLICCPSAGDICIQPERCD